jgi:hypothetical protein
MSEYAERIVRAVLEEIPTWDEEGMSPEWLEPVVQKVQAILRGSETKNAKYIDPEEFGKLGFLQEANRQFFHPHGLALEIICDDGGGANEYPNAVIGGVWDYRDDPEGMMFAWPTWDSDPRVVREKVFHVAAQRNRLREERIRVFDEMYKRTPTHRVDQDVEPYLWRDEDPQSDSV